jgi:hypothetical protein
MAVSYAGWLADIGLLILASNVRLQMARTSTRKGVTSGEVPYPAMGSVVDYM